MNNKIEIEIREHKGFIELEEAVKTREGRIKISQFFGRHHFIYKRLDLGKQISLVELKSIEDKWVWEIFYIDGNNNEIIETFPHKQDADNRIMKLLTPEEQL